MFFVEKSEYTLYCMPSPRGYETLFLLTITGHEISTAHKV